MDYNLPGSRSNGNFTSEYMVRELVAWFKPITTIYTYLWVKIKAKNVAEGTQYRYQWFHPDV